jgi:hypothetical protein
MASQDLTTLEAVRRHQQRTDTTNTTQDDLVNDMITVASDLIMGFTQREFAPTTTAAARKYRYDGHGVLNLAPDDLRSVTSIQIDTDTSSPTTLDSTQYKLWPTRTKHGVYSHIHLVGITVPSVTTQTYPVYRQVTVTGNWGWSSIPDAVERACILLVMDLLSRTSDWRNADFDGLGSSGVSAALPLHVKTMLAQYRRHSAGA